MLCFNDGDGWNVWFGVLVTLLPDTFTAMWQMR